MIGQYWPKGAATCLSGRAFRLERAGERDSQVLPRRDLEAHGVATATHR
jgi:hypothetical protein